MVVCMHMPNIPESQRDMKEIEHIKIKKYMH